MIKKITLALGLLASVCTIDAQNLNTPQPSPTQTLKQNFALSSIEINYSRPGKRGREIFGNLVPYDAVWRTGANSATTLTFGDEVTIGGTKIPAGKYGLLTIPGKDSWTIIISKQTDVTSPAAYKQDMDVVRVTAKPMVMPFAIETFTISIDDIKSNSCEIGLMWDNIYVSFGVTTDIDSRIMAQIKGAMENDNRPYFTAAMYYMDNGKDLNKALEWLNKAAEQNPTAFWVLHQKANCLAKLGKKKEAIETAKKSIELAQAAKNGDYVKLNEDLIKSLN